jgi:hypothetical protein
MRSNTLSVVLVAAMTAIICTGCANAPSEGTAITHAIILPSPTDAERNTLRPSSKGTPLQVGFGREVPSAQRRLVLRSLKWRATSGGYAATISVQSIGARSLRVAMRLNENVSGLEFSFRGSSAIPTSALVIDTGSEPYWSPVINGDTLWIELKTTTLPARDIVLELPLVSHIP